MKPKSEVTFDEFLRLDIRAGRVVAAEPFPEARNPSLKLRVDFGEGVGELQSSAKITRHYEPGALIGRTVLGVVNFPPLRVAGFRSECLILGVTNPDDPGEVVLVSPDRPAAEEGEVSRVGWPLG